MAASENSDGTIIWDMPASNVEGYAVPTDLISYEIAIDGELLEFTTEDTPQLESDVTRLPFDFTNNDNVLNYGGSLRGIVIPGEDYSTVSCTVFVTLSDGSVYSSDRAVYDVANGTVTYESGLEVPRTDSETIASRWYDLTGRAISVPERGVNIRVDIHADGTTTVSKILVK